MSEIITADTILNWLKKQVEEKQIIDGHTWVNAAQKLNMLLEDETDILFGLGQAVKKTQLLKSTEEGESISSSKLFAETTDEYIVYKKQEAKVDRIQEAIRLAKIQARQVGEGMRLKSL